MKINYCSSADNFFFDLGLSSTVGFSLILRLSKHKGNWGWNRCQELYTLHKTVAHRYISQRLPKQHQVKATSCGGHFFGRIFTDQWVTHALQRPPTPPKRALQLVLLWQVQPLTRLRDCRLTSSLDHLKQLFSASRSWSNKLLVRHYKEQIIQHFN